MTQNGGRTLIHRTPLAKGFTPLRFAGVLFVAALFATPTSVSASCDKDPECDDVSAWAVFTRIALRQSVSGSDDAIEWVGLFDHKALDVSIDIAAHGTKEPMAGTVGATVTVLSRVHDARHDRWFPGMEGRSFKLEASYCRPGVRLSAWRGRIAKSKCLNRTRLRAACGRRGRTGGVGRAGRLDHRSSPVRQGAVRRWDG